jgi:DNA-binding transcriptional regulator/RsmH inhibitor MraZ
MIGMRDHVEIWSQQRWNDYFAQRAGHYDELAERAFDAGVSQPQTPRN